MSPADAPRDARRDPSALFRTALTHSSWTHEHGGESYDRLEFLGDAVLELCVTELLLERFPDADEGKLSSARHRLVEAPTLAALSRELGLGEAMRVAPRQAGVRVQEKPLSDVWEAMFGALYLTAGMDACREVVATTVLPRLQQVEAVKAVTQRLQEWCQQRHRTVPEYVELGRSGPEHDRTFRFGVRIGGQLLGEGTGASIKAARKAAAQAAWDQIEDDGA
ncbi:MAG: ribonuclease III [Alphaproteobacteria bacterium]|nr:ribonuclease III [Alphaproteobacteria bacterium]